MLRVKLFGVPQFSLHDKLFVPTPMGRTLALFAYLATQPEFCPRSTLTDLLWRDKTETQARENLRGLLYTLRQMFGDYLMITRQAVAFNRQSPHWMDIAVFGNYLTTDQTIIDPLLHTEVLQLYQGEFLDGFYGQNSPVFEVWLTAQRQQWHAQAIRGWQQLASYHLTHAQYAEGLAATRRLLTLEPWHEEAHRQQMLMLARSGQQWAALIQYERCCQILREEVDAPPSNETVALYEQIKAGQWSSSSSTSIQVTTIDDAALTNTPDAPAQKNSANDVIRAPVPITKLEPPAVAVDWGTMPHEPYFYGRQTELSTLHRWLVTERCRVATILGVGGQGKTALVVRFIRTLTENSPALPNNRATTSASLPPAFERIIWRSLLTAPPLADILQDWLQQLSNQQVVTLPRTLDQQFTLLHEYLGQRRFLLVLDNVESILQDDGSGACRAGYEAYEQLWQSFVQRDHHACLLLTSRERPRHLSSQEEQTGALRTLLLDGLSLSDGQQLLRTHRIIGQESAIAALLQCYSGNPLALKLVADAIDELFAGDIDAFLQEETPFFADIGAVLDQQFARLSPLEQELLTWLAVEQEPVSSQTLWRNLAAPPAKRDYLTALRTLMRRSLMQPQGELFSLQNVILEYTRNRLLNALSEELVSDNALNSQGLSAFKRYALIKAQAKAYVRTGQRRLVLEPLARRLQDYWGQRAVPAYCHQLLARLRRTRQPHLPLIDDYAASNILHLLLQMNVDLRGYDFSQLTLRQACLHEATLQGVSFAAANFQDCLFTDVFAAITTLAFHPNSELLAFGTFDGTARLVRLADNQIHSLLLGHTNAIFGLAISPDGQLLASSSSDQQVRVWDLQTHTLRYNFLETANFVRTVAFSPDSRWLAVAGGDGTVKIYRAASGQLLYTLQSTQSWVWSIAFSPDGHWLAGGGKEGGINLWQISTLTTPFVTTPTRTLHGHQASVETLVFSHDSQLLFSGSRDHLIHLWQLTTGQDKPWHTLRGHHHSVRRLALSPNGRYLASASSDARVCLWDVRNGTLLDTLMGHEQWVWAVAFQPHPVGDTYLLASAGNDQRVLLWEVNIQAGVSRSRLHQTMSGYSDAVRSLAYLPNGQMLVSGGFDKLIHVWDVQRGLAHGVLHGHKDWIFSVAVSADSKFIASAGYERLIYLWPLPDLNELALPPAGRGHVHPYTVSPIILQGHTSIISGLAFSPDGQILASCSQDGMICLWDVKRRQLLQRLGWHTCLVWSVVFSPDGRTLASANFDNTVRLWDVQNLATSDRPASTRLLQTFTGHTGLVWMVAFSPDGKTVISTSNDQTVRLWDVAGQQHRVLTGHTNTVRGLAVSPALADKRFTLASSDDKVIRIWDGQTGELLHRLQGHRGGIHALTYSPDGTILASASEQGGIRLWDGQTGANVQTLRALRPYTDMDITAATGITAAQKMALLSLGAVETT